MHNRIKYYDMGRRCSGCLPYEAFNNIKYMELSDNGHYILTVDTQNYLQILSTAGTLLSHNPFGSRADLACFGAGGLLIATAYIGRV